MQLRSALLAATILAAPIAAMAQPVTGIYIGAGAGGGFQPQTSVKALSFGTVQAHGGHLYNEGQVVGVGSVGYGLGNGLRFEVEGDYRDGHSRLGGAHTTAGFPARGGGDVQTYGVMFNGFYDFDPGLGFLFPYVGAGVGYERERLTSGIAYTVGPAARTLGVTSNSMGNLAAQGILGFAIPIAGIPGLSLTAEYVYHVDTDSDGFRGRVSLPGVTEAGRIKLDSLQSHAGLIGLRYALNAAPAPAPLAPAVTMPPAGAVARTYLVFFDWDRSDLTARARQIIAEAAKNSTAVAATKIEVSGNADRSGTPQYNMGLSLRRAETVAAELVRDGVPRAAINIHAYGDTRPLVPTAAGVREPQNRRVEIVLQ
jgi:outer membrane protein OmpA-like peptidoglycan-associated protein